MSQLTAKDIIAIIRAGNDARVAEITANGVTIKYQSSEPEKPADPIYPYILSTSETPLEASKPNQELDDNLLGITDPAAYEERILRGDLANG